MLRIRERGVGSTHNGLKSVIASLGTDEFIRIRMGVGPEKVWGDLRDYVLSKMGRAEREIAMQMVVDVNEAVELILTEGVNKAMTKFNRRVTPPEEES
jgi:PTH1 family peptidyl-tRNA hydrolase